LLAVGSPLFLIDRGAGQNGQRVSHEVGDAIDDRHLLRNVVESEVDQRRGERSGQPENESGDDGTFAATIDPSRRWQNSEL